MLEVSDLSAWYGAAEVLRGVSLQVRPGEVLAVVGGNGAGKSTLARAVSGIHRAKRGQVRLDGHDLSVAAPSRWPGPGSPWSRRAGGCSGR